MINVDDIIYVRCAPNTPLKVLTSFCCLGGKENNYDLIVQVDTPVTDAYSCKVDNTVFGYRIIDNMIFEITTNMYDPIKIKSALPVNTPNRLDI